MSRPAMLLAIPLVVLLLGACPLLAAEAQTVVMVGGGHLEVAKAVVQGQMVVVTFPDGRMQGLALDEVDLEASGLAPSPSAKAGQAAAKTPVRPPSLAEAQSQPTGGSRFEITDADVDHVKRGRWLEGEAEGEEAEGEPAAAPRAALLVSDLKRELAGGMLSLSGTVTNSGQQPVSSITLEARAEDAGGKTAGSGTTVIGQRLEPKAGVSFTLSFPVEGKVANIRVRATAALADFDLQRRRPPAGEAEGGEGEE